jgi:hypothetical protein
MENDKASPLGIPESPSESKYWPIPNDGMLKNAGILREVISILEGLK